MVTLKFEEPKPSLIDSLLDSYNENIKLYKRFGELCYKERAENFLEILKQHFTNDESNKIT